MNDTQKIFLNNQWKKSKSANSFYTKSFNNKKFYYPDCSFQDLNDVVSSAKNGLRETGEPNYKLRSRMLKRISSLIKSKKNYLAKLETLETGKTFKSALHEVNHCIKLWSYASKISKSHNAIVNLDKKHKGFIRYEPVGIVGLIIPWNFPLIVISERLPFILAAGNSVIIKPSEYASLSIIYLIKILKKAGLPKSTINILFGKGERIGKMIVKNPDINMISFTGSTTVGKKIINASASKVKRLNLELGGKNPIVVFNDADIDNSVKIVIKSFTANAGQACVATSRLLIQKKIKKIFINKLIKKLKIIKSKKNLYGPISNEMQFNKIKYFLNKSKDQKKKLIFGKIDKFKNNFIEPIIFLDLPKNHMLIKSEIFGPILTINTFDKENEAVKFSNDTNYGLSTVICGKNKNRNYSFAKRIQAGRIWINESIDKNFPNLPIGGFKESGLNRECGKDAIKYYSEIKSIIEKK